jgi:hypothetical protein
MPVVPSLEQIAQIFDDRQMQRLAIEAKLPPTADVQRCADGVRDAARSYAEAVRPHASIGYKAPAPEVFVPALAAWPALRNPDQFRRPCSRWCQSQP